MIPPFPTGARGWRSPIARLLAARRQRLVRQLLQRAAWAGEAGTAPALQTLFDADPSGDSDDWARPRPARRSSSRLAISSLRPAKADTSAGSSAGMVRRGDIDG
jgi:hypothetical protein